MKRILPFLFPIIVVPITWYGIAQGGWWTLSGFAFAFVIHPALDLIFGVEKNPPEPDETNAIIYSSLLWMYLPALWALVIFSLYWVTTNHFSWIELTGVALSVGAITGGLGINIAHELVHRRERWERGIGVGMLLLVHYAHFRVEHVFGHHKHVATPLDPASARPGENFYAFLVRSVFQSWFSAWNIESKRLSKRSIFDRIFRHRIIQYTVITALLCAGSYYFFGVEGFYVYVLQGIVAFLTLEAINYIEHYGLQRKEISPGVYEPVTELHSWDSRHMMTNWFLFNLGRHSHHHAQASVPYQKLRQGRTQHTLDHGYSTQILLALIGKNTKVKTNEPN